MGDMTLSDIERHGASDVPMTFRWTRTPSARSTIERRDGAGLAVARHGDSRLAEDLLRNVLPMLRAGREYEDKRTGVTTFRIAMNLVRDHRRTRANLMRRLRSRAAHHPRSSGEDAADRAASRIDLGRAMARLTHRERDLLWLAYAQGSSHDEIAATLGLKATSIKSLLFRARRRLAGLLGRDTPTKRGGQS
jgi:RNA polymerase sigma-70 factor (ECF subfamily)